MAQVAKLGAAPVPRGQVHDLTSTEPGYTLLRTAFPAWKLWAAVGLREQKPHLWDLGSR